MAHDVFISYSAKDKPTADAVCATLESRGIRCWIAPRDILPGMDWGEAIIDAINTSRAIVLVFSANANASGQIKREVERAVSKGIPIIPFRIEDVPLSKSLEYLISTPHWLDALTPPMERHAQYLAQTINFLLHRDANVNQVPVEEPAYSAPTRTESSGFKIGLIAGVIVIPVLLGVFFLLYKFLHSDRSESTNEVSSGFEQKPAEDPSRGGVGESAVDPKLIGEWKTNVVIDRLPWEFNWSISPTGKFRFVGKANDSGQFQGINGRWNRRSNQGERDYGSYFFYNPNSLSMTGLGGTSVLTRISSSASGFAAGIDPQLLGKWQADIVVKGTPLRIYFEAFSNHRYNTEIVNQDSGSIEATNGNWKQTSIRGQSVQGTYTFINQNTASFTSPLGSAVWNRYRSNTSF